MAKRDTYDAQRGWMHLHNGQRMKHECADGTQYRVVIEAGGPPYRSVVEQRSTGGGYFIVRSLTHSRLKHAKHFSILAVHEHAEEQRARAAP